jgi:type IV pilus assembly protein PilP
MKRADWIQIGAYIMAAGLAVGGAFLISSRFLGHARAQEAEAPPAGEAEGAAAPAEPQATAPMPAPTNAQPPDSGNPGPPPSPQPRAQQAPPPPQQAAPQQMPGAPAARPANPKPGDDIDLLNAASQANSGIAELEGFLEPFIYDIVNRRDPFQAYAEYVPPEDTGPPRALSPAQRWDLEQLKLVGIMWDIKDPKAMFLDPEEEVMILGRDESIGNRNGYIAAIREGEVVVVEAIRKRGDIIYRTRVLRIER